MKKTVRSSHDRFFRSALSDTRVAKEFFEFHLPSTIKDAVDLSNLKLRKDSYVDENLKLSVTDILFEAEFLNHPGYLYVLIEHQSTPDILMAFRLLKYLIAIMDQHLKITQGTQLPLIYPLIFYVRPEVAFIAAVQYVSIQPDVPSSVTYQNMHNRKQLCMKLLGQWMPQLSKNRKVAANTVSITW